MSEVGDGSSESNLDSMAHLASPARSSARARRVTRAGQRGVRRLSLLGLAIVLLGGSLLWLRDSSLVAVRDVTVTGVSSSQQAGVRRALRRAALDMTTLHVRRDELRAAVAPYASVADLRADAEFPDTLRIEVVERVPAALLVAGDEHVAVSAGGLVLRGVRPDGAAPVVQVDRLPVGSRLGDRRARAAVAVIAGAPPELRGRIERAGMGSRGLQLELRDGPDLIFGSVSRVRAKWVAATRVLAASGAKGATYLDLRLPEWTAAGGLGPIESPTDTDTASDGATTTDPTTQTTDPVTLPTNPQP